MTRHDVTGQHATFAAIAARYAEQGVAIDHFHCVTRYDDGSEAVEHCNFDGRHWYVEGFRDPSECDDDVIVALWDRVVADEWRKTR